MTNNKIDILWYWATIAFCIMDLIVVLSILGYVLINELSK